MGILKDFFERGRQGSPVCSIASDGVVVSLMDRKNQRVERQLADCMKEIQQLMGSKRRENNHSKSLDRVRIISSSPEISPA